MAAVFHTRKRRQRWAPAPVAAPAQQAPRRRPRASRTEPQPTTPPLELVFTLCWRCTKASLLALVTEMRVTSQIRIGCPQDPKENSFPPQKGTHEANLRLAFEILPSILSDGYVDSRDIEALRNQKGVGEWSVEQLQQLCDTGACSYLMALRARRQ